tara:strand:+ start:3084 stop:4091 length:1008 start_codon:yes stop_codon:yes gene_type:complete
MTTKVGINGFGRIGRLALRAAWASPEFEFVHINEPAGDAATAAHLLKYDSVHGTWAADVTADEGHLYIDGKAISYSQDTAIADSPWRAKAVDLVIECSGKFKSRTALQPFFTAGVKKVVASAPIKDGTLNVVMGINDQLYQPDRDHIVTAASCTTNCLAPVVDVIHKNFTIKHGSITTIHDITNSQSVLDEYQKDLRRARASSLSLIPTTTGSASAIADIFPELKGRLNGMAVRVPLANASLTDCVFEVETPTAIASVNAALRSAADSYLAGILGYEEAPLVSVDYKDDSRSSIIDALSTMVINNTQVKILAWYDNETGYVHRLMELAQKVARSV